MVGLGKLSKICDFKFKVAKFDPKVGSRRTTKILNLVALIMIVVVLILLPFYIYVCGISSHTFFYWYKNDNLKDNFWVTSFTKNLVVRRTTKPQFLVVLIYCLVAEDALILLPVSSYSDVSDLDGIYSDYGGQQIGPVPF